MAWFNHLGPWITRESILVEIRYEAGELGEVLDDKEIGVGDGGRYVFSFEDDPWLWCFAKDIEQTYGLWTINSGLYL